MYWEQESYTQRLARWCKKCDNRFIPKTKYQMICPDCYKESVKKITEKRIKLQQMKAVEA